MSLPSCGYQKYPLAENGPALQHRLKEIWWSSAVTRLAVHKWAGRVVATEWVGTRWPRQGYRYQPVAVTDGPMNRWPDFWTLKQRLVSRSRSTTQWRAHSSTVTWRNVPIIFPICQFCDWTDEVTFENSIGQTNGYRFKFGENWNENFDKWMIVT